MDTVATPIQTTLHVTSNVGKVGPTKTTPATTKISTASSLIGA